MRNIFQNLDPHMDFTHTHTQVCHTGRETNFQAAVSQSSSAKSRTKDRE